MKKYLLTERNLQQNQVQVGTLLWLVMVKKTAKVNKKSTDHTAEQTELWVKQEASDPSLGSDFVTSLAPHLPTYMVFETP